MNGNWSGRTMVLVIILVTVAGFLLWLFGLFLLWLLLNSIGVRADYWAMTEALSTAVTVAAVIGGGIIAYRELTESSSSRHVQVADSLFGELNSPKNIEARRWVYTELPQDPQAGIGSLTPEGQEYVKQTLNSLDRVAFLTQANWIPEETVMPWMNPMIVKSWKSWDPGSSMSASAGPSPTTTSMPASWRSVAWPGARRIFTTPRPSGWTMPCSGATPRFRRWRRHH